MPFIHTSRTQLERPPSGPPRLNLDHPFAQGLRLWVPNADYRVAAYPSYVPLNPDHDSGTSIRVPADNGKTSAWRCSTSQNVSIPSEYHEVTNIGGTQLTLSCWIRPTSTSLKWIVAKPPANTHAAPYALYSILLEGDDDIGARFSNEQHRPAGTGNVDANEDSHIAVTYNGANIRLWIDGEEWGSPHAYTSNIGQAAGDTKFLIGANASATEEFPGDIWGVTLSDRCWDPSEIYDYAHGSRYDLYWTRSATYFMPSIGAGTFNLSLTEDLTVTDTSSETATFPETLTESFDLSDTGIETADFAQILAESIAFTVTATGSTAIALELIESLAFTDASSETATFAETLAESFDLTDTSTTTATLLRALAETLDLTDTASGTTGLLLVLTESLVLTDTASETAVFAASIVEALDLTDTSAISTKTVLKTLLDTLLLTDTATADGGVEMGAGGGSSMTLRQMRRLERQQLLAMIREDDELIVSLVAGLLRNANRRN